MIQDITDYMGLSYGRSKTEARRSGARRRELEREMWIIPDWFNRLLNTDAGYKQLWELIDEESQRSFMEKLGAFMLISNLGDYIDWRRIHSKNASRHH